MSEKTAEQIAAEDAVKRIDELAEALKAAEKRAEDAQRKFEQTKQERTQERDKRQAEAEKSQQYEEAKKLADAKLAEMQEEMAKAQEKMSDFDAIQTKAAAWDTFQSKRREELLALLPESDREVLKDVSLEALEKTASYVTDAKGQAHNVGAARPPAGGGKKWSEMTPDERDNWTEHNMTLPNFRQKQIEIMKT